MACSVCFRDKTIAARGLCRACYSRWQRTGSTEYQRWGKRTTCHVDGCSKRAVSHGLCDMHRQRLASHGHLEQTRPDSWGAKHKHPLFNAWAWMRRSRTKHELVPEWHEDFLQFIADVGERPSTKHKLFSADEGKPLGPDNFIWKMAITEKVEGEDEKTYQARVQKVYRRFKKETYIGYELKKKYGIGLNEYKTLFEKHGGVCAICGCVETQMIRGTTLSLAIDHCHETGRIRGLLCSQCNRGLGLFRDNPEHLERAAEYLR